MKIETEKEKKSSIKKISELYISERHKKFVHNQRHEREKYKMADSM